MATKARTRYTVIGWLSIAALALFLAGVSYAFWVEYPASWVHALIVAGWVAGLYAVASQQLHRVQDHRSEDARSWCPTCHQQYPSHH